MFLYRFIITISISLCFSAYGYSQQYNYYFGDIHTHSSYSDGNDDHILTTPYEDFNYAKKSLHFDFLGISDHNHMLSPLNFHKGLNDADSANENGKFVCLFGIEWGLFANGHVVIYGYDSLIGWEPGNYDVYNSETDYAGLFEKIAASQSAFALLAHPSTKHFSNLISSDYYSDADEAIVGMPYRSGKAYSTD
ncbi:MAG: hypothetical protein HGB12_16735, partial [Bacteroidetes bacterium]|nr:hypothetical protein [Bacteroidota bacterium]